MMTNQPADLSPETAAWLHTQIAISTARAVAPLREELDKVDDWAGGLFVVFLNVLPHLLRTQPELAAKLAPQWRKAAQRFDALQARGARRARDGESLESLEARKMLYRIFSLMELWPQSAKAKGQ
ncbi:hypothetical protein ACAN107058_20250 [Paracidovorax anthurii]